MKTRLWCGGFVASFAAMGLAACAQATTLTNVQTVFLILMENVSWPDLVSGTNAPYLNNVLIPQSSYCSNMFILPGTFGSLPQYLWLESGTNWGVATDSNDPVSHHFATTNHLVIQLEKAGVTWKAYVESIDGTGCPTVSSGLYAAYHNPFVYFDDVYLNATNCANHIRPYTEFARDLTNNTVARYNFITPNLCHDMHGNAACPGNRLLAGDTWLAEEIPRILSSQAYRNRGAIMITWDEGTANAAGPFGTVVLSTLAKGGGYYMTDRLDHTATFRTLQEIFAVPFLYAAQNGASLADLFKAEIQLSASGFTMDRLFQVTVDGIVPGKTNVLQAATGFSGPNALAWANLWTNVVQTNRFIFIDPDASNTPQRFYRVLEQN